MSWAVLGSVAGKITAGLSLRTRMLVLLFAVSLLPLAFSAFIDIHRSRAQLLAADAALLTSGAEQISREIDEFNRGRASSAVRIARYPEIVSFCQAEVNLQAPLRGSVNAILATFPASDPAIAGAAILDDAGHVIAASDSKAVGTDASYRVFVRTALRGRASISDVFLSSPRTGEAPSIAYAEPMRDPQGQVRCAAVLVIHAEALWQRIRASDGVAGPGSFAVLFDNLGIRIGHSYSQDIVFHPGGPLEPDVVAQLIAEKRFGERTQGLLSDVRPFPEQFTRARAAVPDTTLFLGFAPVNHALNYGVARRFHTVPWTLFYMVPEANVRAQIGRHTEQELLLAAGFIVATLLVGLMFVRGIVRPLERLTAAASAIAGGELAARVPRGGDDELGRLAQSFNTMAERVQAQSHALEHARDELEERVVERTAELSASTDSLRAEVSNRERAEQRLQAQLERLSLLDQITRAIGERQDLKSIFQISIRALEDRLPADFGCICSFDQSTNHLQVESVGVNSAFLANEMAMPEAAIFPVDENGLSRCVRGHLVYEDDLAHVDAPFPKRLLSAGLHSLVISPLQSESRVFGVMIVARLGARAFSSGECEFLRQLSAHVALAAKQAELHASLQRAYDDLRLSQQTVLQQERLRALGEMASGIAHDINNAISPATLYAESLLEREANLSPRGREQLQTVAIALDDVAATVARMREFYRAREPQSALQPVQLNELVRHIVDLTRPRWHDMAQQRGAVIELKLDLAPSLPKVSGVEAELREVLTNLVFNAVDAMPSGGTLTLRTSSGGADPGKVTLEVEDTGLGMDETTRMRCLEPFFTTKGERGTGLGLAMVYGVAQRHGADIEIESQPGRGTVFRLVLPVPSSLPDSDVASPLAPTPRGLRILVIDDDPVILSSLEATLSTDGHTVVTAQNGQAGIDAAVASETSGRPFNLVITDLGMPYVDGRRVAAAIKAAAPSMPVVMLTGWGQRLVAEGDVPPHVDLVLAKPPKLQALRAAIAQLANLSNRE